ncbi:hypothetical protein EC991781_2778 [Escherichia coli 99.1781]|nr:hypothetical protein EC991781_2778 [Escherichia coli 99.1781]
MITSGYVKYDMGGVSKLREKNYVKKIKKNLLSLFQFNNQNFIP